MEDGKKNVNIKITSNMYVENLKPSGEAFRRELELEDKTQIITEGKIYSRNNAKYITYEEPEEGGTEDIRTMFSLRDGSMRIRKYYRNEEEDGMDMTLHPGSVLITRYRVPKMVSMDLEVYTNSLKDDLDEDGYGSVSVDYRIRFDKFFSRRNILEIEVTPS